MLRVRSWKSNSRHSERDASQPKDTNSGTAEHQLRADSTSSSDPCEATRKIVSESSTAGPDAPLPTAEELCGLVERVQTGDDTAAHQLFDVFNRGIRYQLVRHLGTTDLDDKVHDTFVIVLQAIVNRDLRDPDKLLAYIRTVVRRQIATYIERAVVVRRESHEMTETDHQDPTSSPEDAYLHSEQRRVMRETLSELGARDREILIRFYLDEMSMEEICVEMDLTQNQFRLLKSRAKARFRELGYRQLRPKVLARYQAAAAQ